MLTGGVNSMLEVDITHKVFDSADGTELEAISRLDFNIPERSFTCMVGPSGCGKTTTLRIILGLDKQYQGRVSMPESSRVAAVFQEPRLLPWRTVRQNIELAIHKAAPMDATNIDALLGELGLTEHQHFFPAELSLGLARRVSLARAYATEPSLLILDEPFVSLDDDTAARLRGLLLSVWRIRPTTVLMVTHNILEAAELADRILILSNRPTRVVDEVIPNGVIGQRSDTDIQATVSEINDKRHLTGDAQ